MQSSPSKVVWIAAFCLLSATAQAQHVPDWFIAAALSPLIVIALAGLLGFLAHNWRVGAVHAGLVFLWLTLFWVVSQNFTNDYIIWAPLVAYAAHTLLILVLIVVSIARRIGARSDAA